MRMLKCALALVVAQLVLSSICFASTKCSAIAMAGSYVRQASPYIDQLTLSIDGRAYWFSSSSFDLILLGTFIPEIGSWTCLSDGKVLVTTVGSAYVQNSPANDVPQPGQPLDINISFNHRYTQKLSPLDYDTLQPTHQIATRVPLSDDPLGPGVVGARSCAPSGNPCDPSPYKRIRPQFTDIP